MGNNTSAGDASPHREQWVKSVVTFSSQYGAGGNRWGAVQICGRPKVHPFYGDNVGAWTPSSYGQADHIELEYEERVIPEGLEIYFTLNPNPITKIFFKKPDGSWDLALERTPAQEATNTSVIFKPEIKLTEKYMTKFVRIEIDSTGFTYWPEIDCVKLIGEKRIIGTCQPPSKMTDAGRKNLELFQNAQFYDMVLVVDGEGIKVHRYLLSVRSKFLDELFKQEESENDGERERSIDCDKHFGKSLSDYRKRNFNQFLRFLYCDYVRLKPNDLFRCYSISKRFKSKEFEDYIIEYFERYVDDDNCVRVLRVSKKYKFKRIMRLCYIHLAKHLEIMKIHDAGIEEKLDSEDVQCIRNENRTLHLQNRKTKE